MSAFNCREQNKVVFVGVGGCGKTALVKRYLTGEFERRYLPTLGVEVYPVKEYVVWDTAGKEIFGGLRDGYYINGKYGVLVIEGSTRFKREKYEAYVNDLKRISPNIKISIVITKNDIVNCEYLQEIIRYALDEDYKYTIVSAKEGNLPEFEEILV